MAPHRKVPPSTPFTDGSAANIVDNTRLSGKVDNKNSTLSPGSGGVTAGSCHQRENPKEAMMTRSYESSEINEWDDDKPNEAALVIVDDTHPAGGRDGANSPADIIASSKQEQSKLAPPSHGRLIPLRQFLVVYACMSLGTLLGALDQTVVATILPQIATQFGAASDISWVGTAFLLTSTAFQPIFGSLCDVLGRKASFVASMAVFAGGTLLCGAAPNITFLITARAIAGLAAGGLMTTVHVIISDVVNLRHRGKYQGMLQMVNALGSSLGPLAGGLFSDARSWRWAFYFQVPVAAAAAVVSFFCLPNTNSGSSSSSANTTVTTTTAATTVRASLVERFKSLDYAGMLLLVAGTSALMTAITYGGSTYPWGHPLVLALLAAGAVAVAAFAYNEAKLAKLPIIPPATFATPAVDLVFVANLCFGAVYFSALYYLPLFFQVVRRQDALHSGVSLVPLTLTTIFFSWSSGLLTSLTGAYKPSLVAGYALMLLASALMAVPRAPPLALDDHTPTRALLLYLLLLGTGMGCQLQNSLVAAQSAVHRRHVARTTAVRNFFRNFGGVLGLGVSAAILNSAVKGGIDSLLPVWLVPDAVTDHIISSPLDLHSMGLNDTHEDIAMVVYVKALRSVFMLWVPASAVSLVCALLVPPYDLDRDDDGDPKRKPFFPRWLCPTKNDHQSSPKC